MRRLVCLRSRGQRGQEVRGQGSEVIPRWQVVVLMGRLLALSACVCVATALYDVNYALAL